MANEGLVTLGKTNFHGQEVTFGIKTDDRRRHVYSIGKTGTGKSNMYENMAIHDIQHGQGVGVVDPHGEFAEKMLDFVPKDRINDVIYFNPGDLDYPIAFNVLESTDPRYNHLIVSGLIGVFKKIWADSWGPRLEYILNNTIQALVEYPNSTLLGINRMLVDQDYRQKVIETIKDPLIKSFWQEEYANYNERFRSEAISPIQNKVGQFLSSSIIRNIVGQTKSKINMDNIINNRKILIVNLSKGRVGEDNSALLGAMIITKIQMAALNRASIPPEERKDFYLYVDEFQNFATEAFGTILSEARKYNLCLNITHQYMGQLEEPLRDAIIGNIGTMILFRIGSLDAEEFVKEFTPTFTETDLVNVPNYNIYVRLMIDGVTSAPFSATTIPPREDQEGNMEKIINVSRERHASKREVIDDKISRWAASETTLTQGGGGASNMEKRISARQGGGANADAPPIDRELFDAACTNCGVGVQVPFKPDKVRPVYCKDCLAATRALESRKATSSETEEATPAAAEAPTAETPSLKTDPPAQAASNTPDTSERPATPTPQTKINK